MILIPLLLAEVIPLPPIQNLRNSLVSGLWPAGGGCLEGCRQPEARPGIRHRALRLVAPGTCLAIRGRGVWFLCDLTFDLNQDTGIKNQTKEMNYEGAMIIHQGLD